MEVKAASPQPHAIFLLGFWCGVAPQYIARRRLYSDPHGGFLNVFRFQEHAWQCCLLSGDMRRHLEKLLPLEVPPEPFVLGRAASVLANSSSLRPRALLQETSPSLACLLEPTAPGYLCAFREQAHCLCSSLHAPGLLTGSFSSALLERGRAGRRGLCSHIPLALCPSFLQQALPLNTSESRTWCRLGELGELCPP